MYSLIYFFKGIGSLNFASSTGAFGAPASASPFGQSSTGFGGFGQQALTTTTPTFGGGGGGGMFGAQPAANTNTNMFGQQQLALSPFGQPQASAFGAPAPAASTAFSFGQPAAQPAGGMFGAPAAAPAFGSTPAFGQQPAATGFGSLGGGFGSLGGFGQPAPAAATSFGAPATTSFGGFGAPAPAAGGMFGGLTGFGQAPTSAFGAPAPTASTAFSFGQPAAQPAGGMFGAPAATPAFGAPAAAPAFGSTPAFGQQPAATGFGALGGGFGSLGGFGAPAAATNSGFGAPAAAAPAFGGFGAPASAAGGMFGGLTGFGLPAATTAATPTFGGFGGFGTGAQAAKPATTGFSSLSTPLAAFGMPAGSLGGGAPQQSMFGMAAPTVGGLGTGAGLGFGQQQPVQQQPPGGVVYQAPLGYASLDQKMELLKSKRDEMDIQLKDARLYGGGSGPTLSNNSYNNSTSFSMQRSLPSYQRTSRSTAKIVPRGLITSATMATTQNRPLSSVLSASSSSNNNNNNSIDLMSPEKLLGRSAKRLIIVSTGTFGSDPTIDLPLPSYQQKQILNHEGQGQQGMVRFHSDHDDVDRLEITQGQGLEGITPPRALLLEKGNRGSDRRSFLTYGNSGGSGSGDVTGLTPSNNRSPYTPNSGEKSGNRNGDANDSNNNSYDNYNSNNNSNNNSNDKSNSQRLITQRISTPYLSKSTDTERGGERGREKESLDRSITSPPLNSLPYPHSYSITNDDYESSNNPEYFTKLIPTLLRPSYLTTPSLAALQKMSGKELSKITNFSVYRPNIGKIIWEGETDVRGLDLDIIVTIEKRGVEVYDNEESILLKPDIGQGLNKTAVIFLNNIFPAENSTNEKIKQFPEKLKKICLKSGSEFLDYDSNNGEWIFRVKHFSRYGIDDDSDDENADVNITPKVVKKTPIVLNTMSVNNRNSDNSTKNNENKRSQIIEEKVKENDRELEIENDRNAMANAQYAKYSLTMSSDIDPSDLKRMRLSFSQSFSKKNSGTPGQNFRDKNQQQDLVEKKELSLQSGIFSPRGVISSGTSTSTSNESHTPIVSNSIIMKKEETGNMMKIKKNENLFSSQSLPTRKPPSPIIPIIATEMIQAVNEAKSHPYHLVNESPCMQILLKVKNDYLLKTGQNLIQIQNDNSSDINKNIKLPIITKVSGTGLPVNKVLQRRPVDYALSLGRSFRVGWGPNNEIIHAGKLLFNADDLNYGKTQRVVVEKINTLNWIENKEKKNEIENENENMMDHSSNNNDNNVGNNSFRVMSGFESSLKTILCNSFVFNNFAASTYSNEIDNNNKNSSNNDGDDAKMMNKKKNMNYNNISSYTRTMDTTSNMKQDKDKNEIVPIWRTPHAKPYELNEYIPYLNILESLINIYDDKKLNKFHPDWLLYKGIELFHATNGQEKGSYTVAKSLYLNIGNGNKLHIQNDNNNRSNSSSNDYNGTEIEIKLISELNSIRDQLDFLPVFEDRDGYQPVDWDRRKEAISTWLTNITTVEGIIIIT